MERRDLILELCREVGETGFEDEIVEECEANHACCCNLNVGNAVQGYVDTLNKISTCMELPLMR